MVVFCGRVGEPRVLGRARTRSIGAVLGRFRFCVTRAFQREGGGILFNIQRMVSFFLECSVSLWISFYFVTLHFVAFHHLVTFHFVTFHFLVPFHCSGVAFCDVSLFVCLRTHGWTSELLCCVFRLSALLFGVVGLFDILHFFSCVKKNTTRKRKRNKQENKNLVKIPGESHPQPRDVGRVPYAPVDARVSACSVRLGRRAVSFSRTPKRFRR